MTFGEKVKQERNRLNLTQDELAGRMGVTRRVITSYETDKSRPSGTEDDAFLAEVSGKYGSRGAKQAQALVSEVSGLFAGGEMAEEDMDEMMEAIQKAYWIAKKNNKKFTPKKYVKDEQ